ncbi:MAG: TIGR04282 family arsenosugar biosynthesis glycosyltransferase, partial [Gammaproteobacteria bacterium]|nr:TIGR04282 family arsenosugar biosynthesis glycosyltransferase [Gammaproteobacteria bacterium]
NIALLNQPGGDLGQKMSTALFNALLDYKKVVLIGADIPAIDSDYIQQAFTMLDQDTTVIGPAEDGGYVLIGLTKPQPAIFESIDWGSSKVLQQTIEQLEPEIPVLLDTLWDVDRPEDVERFKKLLIFTANERE